MVNSANTPDGGKEPVKELADALDREIKGLVSAQSLARWIWSLLFLALLAFVGTSLFVFYNIYKDLQSQAYQEKVQKEAKSYLEKNNDRYMKEVQKLLDKSGPVLTETAWKQVKSDMPNFMTAIEKERETFRNELTTRITKKFETSYEKELEKHKQLLQKEFKQIEDPVLQQKMMKNLAMAAEGLSRKYFVQKINDEINTLFKGWDSFPTAGPPGKGEEKLEDQLLYTIWEVVMQKIALNSAPASK